VKERDRGRERERENCPELLFLKGRALAPFSYLVMKKDVKFFFH
jgi:hypothetical protein